jgi:beta-fructofuranosidase
MLSIPGYLIGDSWFYVHEGRVHCYFLFRPSEGGQYGTDIGHAVSEDLVNWKYEGIAVKHGSHQEFDSQSCATGSVLERDGRFWMAYSGVRKDEAPFERKVFRVGMAFSDDLYHWTKIEGNPVTEADGVIYERVGSGLRTYGHWRDPFLLDAGERVRQYVTARRVSEDPARRGTIAVATSDDMITWRLEQPLEVDPVAEELEVPQVLEIGGLYYLKFCTVPKLLLADFKARFPGYAFRRADYSMVGPSPLGPFRVHGTGEIIPHSAPEAPYASQLIKWDNSWSIIGTIAVEGSNYLCDPMPVVADDTGLHVVL